VLGELRDLFEVGIDGVDGIIEMDRVTTDWKSSAGSKVASDWRSRAEPAVPENLKEVIFEVWSV